MTDQLSPITPPPELVLQWLENSPEDYELGIAGYIATQAARWGYQQRVRSSPECPLVERVADAIAAEATSAGIVNDRPARAAILQVAMWLREQDTPASNWAMRLEQEATPSPRRPKPPSLKEQALEALDQEEEGLNESEWEQRFAIIRRALEALPE